MELDIQELKRLNAAATQGEWKATLPRSGRWQISNGRVQVAAVWSTTDNPGKDVAEYIAAMHNAFPALIARLEAAEAAMQWRPIAEAPESRPLTVGVRLPNGDWHSPGGRCEKGFAIRNGYTHYMPLPAPPEAAR